MLSSCLSPLLPFSSFFFFNDTAPTEIYTLPLHDALPILFFEHRDRERFFGRKIAIKRALGDSRLSGDFLDAAAVEAARYKEFLPGFQQSAMHIGIRSEEHTSELQSRQYLVCRLLLEKKNK